MRNHLKIAQWMLRFGVVAYLIVGALFLFVAGSAFLNDSPESEEGAMLAAIIMGVIGLVAIGLACGIDFVRAGLRDGKRWAWTAGLCVFAVYMTSLLFIPFGAIGLWSLLNRNTRQYIDRYGA